MIDDDASPGSEKHFYLLNPNPEKPPSNIIKHKGDKGITGIFPQAVTAVVNLTQSLKKRSVRTILFCKVIFKMAGN